jgi:tRNA-binding protein
MRYERSVSTLKTNRVRICYNPEGIGDVLLVELNSSNGETVYERKGDVALIRIKDSGEVVGLNIFSASAYFSWPETNGLVQADGEQVGEIERALHKNGVDLTIEYDPYLHVVVGEVIEVKKHPDADKLKVCRVSIGNGEELQIVCGASNVAEGIKVPTALIGAILPNGMEIKEAKLRGVVSKGMLCSAKELGISETPGLLILPENLQPGTSFERAMVE